MPPLPPILQLIRSLVSHIKPYLPTTVLPEPRKFEINQIKSRMKNFFKKKMSGEPSLTVSKEEATELSFGEKKLLGILVCCDSCQEDGITDEICQHRDHNYTSQLCSRIRQLKNWKRADNAINYVTSLTKAREERLLLLHLTEEKLQDVRLLRTLSRRRKKIAPSPPGHLIKTVSSNLPTNLDNGSSHGTLIVIQELPVSSTDQVSSSHQPLPRISNSRNTAVWRHHWQ